MSLNSGMLFGVFFCFVFSCSFFCCFFVFFLYAISLRMVSLMFGSDGGGISIVSGCGDHVSLHPSCSLIMGCSVSSSLRRRSIFCCFFFSLCFSNII